MSNVSMRQMLEAGVHFGHQTRYWSPKMRPYIFGERNKIHIINLEKTVPMLKEAMTFLNKLAANGGTILFVGTKRQAGEIIGEQANRCASPYVNHRWLGGMLTNFQTVKNSIRRLKELEVMGEDGSLLKLAKKEVLKLDRERSKLHRSLAGIKDMAKLPDALFIVDIGHEDIAVAEAKKLKIPVIAVVDTNCAPDDVDYTIPGNDDAIRAISLYVSAAADAVLAGQEAAATQLPGRKEEEYVEMDSDDAEEVLAEVEKDKKVPKAKDTIDDNTEKKTVKKKAVKKKVATKTVKKAVKKVVKKKTVTKKASAGKEN
ncbi:MAG TPA: 30S ribosomal protein S2 [Acidiferrobacteraceae bacterium]|nr:30S ribosomal protein S2 [Acidiferrobacteraceae bacterium]